MSNDFVLNVAPINPESLTQDPLGAVAGRDVPVGITGVAYSVVGTFTAAGRLDHQTATVRWRDGSVEQSSMFRPFSDVLATRSERWLTGHNVPG